MGKFIIQYGNEEMIADENGYISRPAIKMNASGNWKLTGAMQYNNFGNVVRYFTFEDLKRNDIRWTYKNGKQRVHAIDLDHGTRRVWGSPKHTIRYIKE